MRAQRVLSEDGPCRMLDKTKQTGSPLQLVNGLILLSTFAGARLVYGFTTVRMLHRNVSTNGLIMSPPPVIPVLPDALRGAGRPDERRIRWIRLRECDPERTERVLVRYVSHRPQAC
jgi:hypothetical protein